MRSLSVLLCAPVVLVFVWPASLDAGGGCRSAIVAPHSYGAYQPAAAVQVHVAGFDAYFLAGYYLRQQASEERVLQKLIDRLDVKAAQSKPTGATRAQAPASDEKSTDINTLFSRRCAECHGEKPRGNKMSLTEPALADLKKLDRWYIWGRVSEGDMPPAPRESLTEAEAEIVRHWRDE